MEEMYVLHEIQFYAETDDNIINKINGAKDKYSFINMLFYHDSDKHFMPKSTVDNVTRRLINLFNYLINNRNNVIFIKFGTKFNPCDHENLRSYLTKNYIYVWPYMTYSFDVINKYGDILKIPHSSDYGNEEDDENFSEFNVSRSMINYLKKHKIYKFDDVNLNEIEYKNLESVINVLENRNYKKQISDLKGLTDELQKRLNQIEELQNYKIIFIMMLSLMFYNSLLYMVD